MPNRRYNSQMGRYGSGTLFQRGGGIWYYQAYVDGRQIGPLSSHSTDRRDAQRELDKLLGKRARGEISFTPRQITIGSILQNYLSHAKSLESNTLKQYENAINNQLIPVFGSLKPERLTTEQLQHYRERRLSSPTIKVICYKDETKKMPSSARTVGQSSINRELAVLRAALNYALETNKDLSFPIPRFPMVREKNVRKGFLKEEAFEKQFWELPYWGARALSATSFYTGVRRGELTKLNWEQVDFHAGVISLYETKNHEAREVPIFDGLMLVALQEAKKEHDECWPECPAVFTYRGKRLGNPKRSWKTAAQKTSVAGTHLHDLRRSANRNMRDLGVPQPIRMNIMGHLTPSMDRRYGIVDRTDLDVVRELHRRQQQEKTTAKTTAREKDTQ